MSFVRRTSLKVDDTDVLLSDLASDGNGQVNYGTPPPKPVNTQHYAGGDDADTLCSLTGRLHADKIIQQCLEERKLTMENLQSLYRDLFVTESRQLSKCIRVVQDLFDIQMVSESELKEVNVLSEIRRILYMLLGKRCLLFYLPQYESDFGDTSAALPQPATHLTLWAILVDLPHMVIDLLRTTEFPIGLLLVSSAQYKAMSVLAEEVDSTISALWMKRSRSLEKAACDLLTSLNLHDHHAAILAVGDAMDILDMGVRGDKLQSRNNLEDYENLALVSPLDVATEYDLRDFMSHQCVLTFLRKKFYNEINPGRRSWVFFPLFWIPPLPYFLHRPLHLFRFETGKYLCVPRDSWNRRTQESLCVKLVSTLSPSPITANVPPSRCDCCPSENCCPGNRSRLYFTAPINIFQYYMLSTLALLGLLCYSLMTDFHLEWLVALWLLSFFINDIQQMLGANYQNPLEGFSWSEKKSIADDFTFTPWERARILLDCKIARALYTWVREEWNLLDLAVYFFFLLGFITHQYSPENDGATRAIYALCFLLMSVKVFRFMMLSRILADIAISLYLIIKSILPVALILLGVSSSFGVSSLAVLHPALSNHQSPATSRQSFLAFTRPFWYLFGVLQLQDMQRDMQESANISCQQGNFDMFDPDTWKPCYTGWLATFFAAFFLVIVHLVLITYLIGMVSVRYRETRSVTHRIWCIQIARLVKWTSTLPLPPPPLNIAWIAMRLAVLVIVLLFVFIGWSLRVICYEDSRELPSRYPMWSSCYQWFLEKLWFFCREEVKQYSRPSWEKRKILLDEVLPNFDFRSTYRRLDDFERPAMDLPKLRVDRC